MEKKINKLLLILLCLPLLFTTCKKEEEHNNTLEIGDYSQGGIIFYLDSSGQHGLVCDINSLGMGEWGCLSQNVPGADEYGIGTGLQNTLDIINANCQAEPANPNGSLPGNIVAAEACYNSTANGYSDWFLPSGTELRELALNIATINTALNANGGDSIVGKIWTSTSTDDDMAGCLAIYNWPSDTNSFWTAYNWDMDFSMKDDLLYVRAVREF